MVTSHHLKWAPAVAILVGALEDFAPSASIDAIDGPVIVCGKLSITMPQDVYRPKVEERGRTPNGW